MLASHLCYYYSFSFTEVSIFVLSVFFSSIVSGFYDRDIRIDITLCDKVCPWLATGWWFSPCTLVSTTNKTDRHDITKILLKVALNTITLILHVISFSIFSLALQHVLSEILWHTVSKYCYDQKFIDTKYICILVEYQYKCSLT